VARAAAVVPSAAFPAAAVTNSTTNLLERATWASNG
jgi:hypothetical protein